MKGIILDKVGGEFSLADNLEKPTPGKKQILVKSLATALNAVEGYMHMSGLMVVEFPIVLGADASGTVVEVGEGVTKFKVGDGVFSCTVLGTPGHSPFQEYHLMNEDLTFKRPENVTAEEAATIGVGLLTAGLGVVIGTNVDLKVQQVADKSPWIVISGGAGSVGQFAIQLAKLTGYKVLASCSPSNDELVKSIGADATFSYKLSVHEQIAEIEKITGGNYTRVFDASAEGIESGMAALAQNKSSDKKYFSTVNDWTSIDPVDGIEVYVVTLGEIGRTGNAHIEQTNKDIADLIVKLQPLLDSGKLKPLEYVTVGDVGVAEILKGLQAFNTHKSGKKLVVRLAKE